jgi:hypothetical protein
MWDCGPFSDLYEPLDVTPEEVDEWLHQPMEFAANNTRAFLWDVGQAAHCGGSCTFTFGKPVSGRFRFDLILRSWRTDDPPEHTFMLWMPSERLCQIRDMPATDGRRRTVLLNGESLFWEDAVQVIANQIRESRSR